MFLLTLLFPTDLQVQIDSLPARGAAGAGDIALSLVTVVNKSALCSEAYFISHYRKHEIQITSKLFWRRSFNFETCIAQFIQWSIKAFWKIYLWRSVLILWRVATNYSMYGKHWTLSSGHNLSDNKNKEILILAVKCRPIMSNAIGSLNGCHDNKCHEGKVSISRLCFRLGPSPKRQQQQQQNDLHV